MADGTDQSGSGSPIAYKRPGGDIKQFADDTEDPRAIEALNKRDQGKQQSRSSSRGMFGRFMGR
jgi:hypothetical protein